MNNNTLSFYWIRIAVLYLLIGITMGCVMGATNNFTLRSVHAHINLLGWATMLGVGLLTRQYRDALSSRLGQLQFWLHQIGLPIMLGSLTALLNGHPEFEPVLGASSVSIAVATLVFVFNVWRVRRIQSEHQ